jgi:membrane-associated protease RseP (regulator of RpoE activity)
VADPRDRPIGSPRPRRAWINVVLFVTTLLTVFATGTLFLSRGEILVAVPDGGIAIQTELLSEALSNGLQFMLALMGILVCHEAGHFIMARRNRVDASLPYFIPIPPLISMFGTMGAVIVMRGRIRSRNALMEVGAAGPVAGMIVAVPVLLVGLARCPVGPLPEGGWIEGQSLLYVFAKWIVIGPIEQGYDIYVDQSPLAWAGWIGLLVTTLNLLPIGQLDGGHVFYALWGEAHARASRIFHFGLFALGAAVMAHGAWEAHRFGLEGTDFTTAVMPGVTWIFLGGLLLVLGRLSKRGLRHPPTDDDNLSTGHRALGFLCILIFVVTFMPVLMRPVIM